MMRALFVAGVMLLAGAAISGCSNSDLPREKTIQVKFAPPLDRAKAMIQRYADGSPLGSEVSGIDPLIEEVRKTDPQKADVLQKGFAELKNAPRDLPAKAKALLSQL